MGNGNTLTCRELSTASYNRLRHVRGESAALRCKPAVGGLLELLRAAAKNTKGAEDGPVAWAHPGSSS